MTDQEGPSAEETHRIAMTSRRLQSEGYSTDVAGLLKALSDESMAIRTEAVFLLGLQSDDETLEALRKAIRDSSARVRVEAARGLARRGEEDSAQALLRQELSGEFFADAPLRAAYLLAQMGDASGYRRVLEALRSALASNRMEAIAALPAFLPLAGKEVDGQAVDPVGALLDAVGDPEEILRRDALSALAESGDPRAREALLTAKSDPVESVRELARQLLGET